jgi:hypothetical protein
MNLRKNLSFGTPGGNVDTILRSPYAKKSEDEDYDDNKTNEIDNAVHGGAPLCFFFILREKKVDTRE